MDCIPRVPWIVLRSINWMTVTRASEIGCSLPRTISRTYLCVRNVPGKWKQTVKGCGSGGHAKRTIARDMTPLLMPNVLIPFTVALNSSSLLLWNHNTDVRGVHMCKSSCYRQPQQTITWSSRRLCLSLLSKLTYRVAPKRKPQTFVNIFAEYCHWPIFKIFHRHILWKICNKLVTKYTTIV